jgi:hypothetical protein
MIGSRPPFRMQFILLNLACVAPYRFMRVWCALLSPGCFWNALRAL